MKNKSRVTLSAFIVSVGLIACGGGGSNESVSSGGSYPARETGAGVPAQALVDGQAFVTWLKTLVAEMNPQAEPIKIEESGEPIDESAEPRML